MSSLHNPENRNNSHAALPSLGKRTEDETPTYELDTNIFSNCGPMNEAFKKPDSKAKDSSTDLKTYRIAARLKDCTGSEYVRSITVKAKNHGEAIYAASKRAEQMGVSYLKTLNVESR